MMEENQSDRYRVIGLMSGTSLDGLDLVAAGFELNQGAWSFIIHHAKTQTYPDAWKNELQNAAKKSGLDLIKLHNRYGKWLGQQVLDFMEETGFNPDLVASHGHTVFHQPEHQITFQLGSGHTLAATCGLNSVWDFRSQDVALGGQGAPLVPVGDKMLFPQFRYCLNLGGIANISYDVAGERIAYDICPSNLAMQYLVKPLGRLFDRDGEAGRKGHVHPQLLERLNQLPFYNDTRPKSLGREWIDTHFLPLFNQFELTPEDKLSTLYEHIGYQIGRTVKNGQGDTMLVTGGGAHNRFLVERIRHYSAAEVMIPDPLIVDFKEALIFAFLGVLRIRNEINCFASVTGAAVDSSSGVIVKLNHN